MRRIRFSLGALSALFANALAAAAFAQPVGQPVCLDARNMRDSTAVNGHTIMMSMIDGTRWRGTLTTDCPGLRYNGFVIFPANSDYVCEGIQSIRVLQNHQVCRIGKIEKLPPRIP